MVKVRQGWSFRNGFDSLIWNQEMLALREAALGRCYPLIPRTLVVSRPLLNVLPDNPGARSKYLVDNSLREIQ